MSRYGAIGGPTTEACELTMSPSGEGRCRNELTPMPSLTVLPRRYSSTAVRVGSSLPSVLYCAVVMCVFGGGGVNGARKATDS